jgi:hypothetical protein
MTIQAAAFGPPFGISALCAAANRLIFSISSS